LRAWSNPLGATRPRCFDLDAAPLDRVLDRQRQLQHSMPVRRRDLLDVEELGHPHRLFVTERGASLPFGSSARTVRVLPVTSRLPLRGSIPGSGTSMRHREGTWAVCSPLNHFLIWIYNLIQMMSINMSVID
jgi:hypothetical protein